MQQKTKNNLQEWGISLTIGLSFALICLLWGIIAKNKQEVEYESISIKYFLYCKEKGISEPNDSTWLEFRKKK